jgi:hypothetical protein
MCSAVVAEINGDQRCDLTPRVLASGTGNRKYLDGEKVCSSLIFDSTLIPLTTTHSINRMALVFGRR